MFEIMLKSHRLKSLAFEFLSEHCEEDGEVDRPRRLLQHLINLLLLHIEPACYRTEDEHDGKCISTRVLAH